MCVCKHGVLRYTPQIVTLVWKVLINHHILKLPYFQTTPNPTHPWISTNNKESPKIKFHWENDDWPRIFGNSDVWTWNMLDVHYLTNMHGSEDCLRLSLAMGKLKNIPLHNFTSHATIPFSPNHKHPPKYVFSLQICVSPKKGIPIVYIIP